jgi:predicted DNA-binding transcriptional regulator YafY
LLSMLLLLQARGRANATELAREFEVSVRTIYRDVDALSASGVPIRCEPGRNGGVRLDAGYRARLTGLTAAEAGALPLAGLAGAARDLGVHGDATSAQLKLLASLPAAAGELAARIAQRFHLDPIPWYQRAESIDCLQELAAAVWRDRRIAISYRSWRRGVRRRLTPLGLVQKGGLWYLVATAGGAVRTYRVASIRRLAVLEATARRPAGFDLAAWWEAWSADFESRLAGERARVRISPEGRRILRAVASATAEAVAATGRPCGRRGWVEAEIPVEAPGEAARQLLRLGAEIEVLGPASLQSAVRREARRVAALYA